MDILDTYKLSNCMADTLQKTLTELEEVKKVAADFHWMARRYADGRSSYATRTFNENTRKLKKIGVKLIPSSDKTIWACDAMGRGYDGLSHKEAIPGTKEAMGES